MESFWSYFGKLWLLYYTLIHIGISPPVIFLLLLLHDKKLPSLQLHDSWVIEISATAAALPRKQPTTAPKKFNFTKKTKILHSNFYYYYYFKMYYHPSHLNFQRKKAPRQCGGVTATTGELAPAKLSPIWRNYCIKPSQLLLLLLIHRISWEVKWNHVRTTSWFLGSIL